MRNLQRRQLARIRRNAKKAERHVFEVIELTDSEEWNWFSIEHEIELAISYLQTARDLTRNTIKECEAPSQSP